MASSLSPVRTSTLTRAHNVSAPTVFAAAPTSDVKSQATTKKSHAEGVQRTRGITLALIALGGWLLALVGILTAKDCLRGKFGC
jgi:hypothetical protein